MHTAHVVFTLERSDQDMPPNGRDILKSNSGRLSLVKTAATLDPRDSRSLSNDTDAQRLASRYELSADQSFQAPVEAHGSAAAVAA